MVVVVILSKGMRISPRSAMNDVEHMKDYHYHQPLTPPSVSLLILVKDYPVLVSTGNLKVVVVVVE